MKEEDHGTHVQLRGASPAETREKNLLMYGDKIGTFISDVADLSTKQGIGAVFTIVLADGKVKINAFSSDPACHATVTEIGELVAGWMKQKPGYKLELEGPSGHG